MSDYTPTTAEVRDSYRYSNQRPDICGKDFGLEFDRWLAERDAEVAAKAYERAILDVGLNPDLANQLLDTNPYRKAVQDD